MLQSHVISIDGTFVGAAVRLDRGYRFVATDTRMNELDGSWWPTLEVVRQCAHRLYRTGGLAFRCVASTAGSVPAGHGG